jgi:hypothetical protein
MILFVNPMMEGPNTKQVLVLKGEIDCNAAIAWVQYPTFSNVKIIQTENQQRNTKFILHPTTNEPNRHL